MGIYKSGIFYGICWTKVNKLLDDYDIFYKKMFEHEMTADDWSIIARDYLDLSEDERKSCSFYYYTNVTTTYSSVPKTSMAWMPVSREDFQKRIEIFNIENSKV